jgi:hypothetical protein
MMAKSVLAVPWERAVADPALSGRVEIGRLLLTELVFGVIFLILFAPLQRHPQRKAVMQCDAEVHAFMA